MRDENNELYDRFGLLEKAQQRSEEKQGQVKFSVDGITNLVDQLEQELADEKKAWKDKNAKYAEECELKNLHHANLLASFSRKLESTDKQALMLEQEMAEGFERLGGEIA